MHSEQADPFASKACSPASSPCRQPSLALVNPYILYQWAGVRVGLITARHSRKLTSHQTPTGYANSVVYYECDKTEAHHTLCFDSYNDDEVDTSRVSTWVLLDRGAGNMSGSCQTASKSG